MKHCSTFFLVLKCCVTRQVEDRGRDTSLPGTPRTDPDGRSLAHPVLISDE